MKPIYSLLKICIFTPQSSQRKITPSFDINLHDIIIDVYTLYYTQYIEYISIAITARWVKIFLPKIVKIV